jgi:AraC family transcriptional regulator
MMDHLRQIQRAVDYIEDHLYEDLSVGTIAKVAGFSKWHFQMVFSSAVGDTLKEYIRKRRLTAAIIALGTTERRILDIALDAGFESQESFTRAFKTMFHKTPGDCRKGNAKSVMFRNKPKITMEYLDHLYRGVNMEPVLQFVEEKKVIGIGARFISALSPDRNNSTVIPHLWAEYNPRGQEISARLSFADMGVVVCIDDAKEKSHPDECYYMACAEVTSTEEIPQGMTTMTIPAGNYAVFTHRGTIAKIDFTMNFIYGSWLPKSNRKLREAPEMEVYDHRFRPNSDESEFDIYIPID